MYLNLSYELFYSCLRVPSYQLYLFPSLLVLAVCHHWDPYWLHHKFEDPNLLEDAPGQKGFGVRHLWHHTNKCFPPILYPTHPLPATSCVVSLPNFICNFNSLEPIPVFNIQNLPFRIPKVHSTSFQIDIKANGSSEVLSPMQ